MMKRWGNVIAVFAITSCHPKVDRWNVRPHAYCPSTAAIHVEWKGKHGEVRLEITEPGQPKITRPLESAGSLDLPPKPMDLLLVVQKNDQLAPSAPAVIRSVADLRELAGRGDTCTDGWMHSAPFEYGGSDPTVFDPNVRLGSISNACDAGAGAAATCRREVRIKHAGQDWALAAGGARDVSAASVTVGGSWTLEQKLLPGEQCGDATAEPALDFALTIAAVCEEVP